MTQEFYTRVDLESAYHMGLADALKIVEDSVTRAKEAAVTKLLESNLEYVKSQREQKTKNG